MSTSTLIAPAPAGAPKARTGGRKRFNQVMKLVRRAHLYAGLFMTPWVFLYGVTAVLFNHPDLFSDQAIRRFGPESLEGTAFAGRIHPAALAERVVAALNAPGAEGKAEGSYRLIRPDEAAFPRELFGSIRGAKEEHSVRIDLETGYGSVRTGPLAEQRGGIAPATGAGEGIAAGRKAADDPAGGHEQGRPGGRGERPARGSEGASEGPGRPQGGETGPAGREGRGEAPRGGRGAGDGGAPARVVTLDPPALGAIEPGLTRVVEKLGLDGKGLASVRSVPELAFVADKGGEAVRLSYNLRTGAVAERPADQPARSVSTRRFLLQLHTAHGYPSEPGARWAWALAVDIMAVCMIGWGLTGLLMWWQMKNVRAIGAVVLVLSAVAAAASVIGMHQAITS